MVLHHLMAHWWTLMKRRKQELLLILCLWWQITQSFLQSMLDHIFLTWFWFWIEHRTRIAKAVACRGSYLLIIFHLSMACFTSNLIAQSTMVYMSVFVLMLINLFHNISFFFILTMVLWLSPTSFLVFSWVGLVLVETQLTCAKLTLLVNINHWSQTHLLLRM